MLAGAAQENAPPVSWRTRNDGGPRTRPDDRLSGARRCWGGGSYKVNQDCTICRCHMEARGRLSGGPRGLSLSLTAGSWVAKDLWMLKAHLGELGTPPVDAKEVAA